MITVSVVSHGHGAMVGRLVAQLQNCKEISRIVVTHNVPEPAAWIAEERLKIINNPKPKGFGANHNAAFRYCESRFFCVLNPDIELIGNPFSSLVRHLEESNASIAAPLILSPAGEVEDSVRRFPTIPSLFMKALGGSDGRYAILPGQAPMFPQWIAGMFMLFGSTDFARLKGFDEKYFLYYEDVDICTRAWDEGMRIVVCPSVSAIHDARRQSRKNLRHMRWHLESMMRYLFLS